MRHKINFPNKEIPLIWLCFIVSFKLPAVLTQARLFMDTSPRSITIMVVLHPFLVKPDSTFRVQRPGPVALDSGVGKEPNAKASYLDNNEKTSAN